jgi:hypothetical protein
VDVDASNGVIHSISRVLFPPPVFTKEQAIRDAIAYNESVSGAGLHSQSCVNSWDKGRREFSNLGIVAALSCPWVSS